MIVPWQVTKGNAHIFIDELEAFDGMVLISPHQPGGVSLQKPFSDEMRQEIVHRLSMELDDDYHLWLASGRHTIMYSFLHTQILSAQDACVDLLCSVKWGYQWQTNAYKGFGEFILLISLLERRGIRRFRLPLTLDVNVAGLVTARWLAQGQGIYGKA
jgi:hypothetical protein